MKRLFQYDAEKHIAMEKADSREEGEFLLLISLITKKVQKSKTLETIADELECELEEIQKFYDAIQHCGVECTAEEILENVYARR